MTQAKKNVLLTAALACLITPASAIWYTDESAFLAAMDPTYYLETFDGFEFGVTLNGTQTTWTAPGGNGYGWDAFAALGLWSLDGAISTDSPGDPIIFQFTGNAVRAVGGTIFGSDFAGAVVPNSEVTISLSTGQSSTIFSDGTSFLGWVGQDAILDIEVFVEQPVGVNVWVGVDNLYTGTFLVPEPGTIVAIGIGSLLALARRRK